MFTTKILEALDRMKVIAKIKELRKSEGLPEKQDLPKVQSHPVFTQDVFKTLLKIKNNEQK